MSAPSIAQLEPSTELRFQGPFDHVVTSVLKITNPSPERTVCFKVKTTAPKRYCVRPNSGVIEPKKSVEVQVMLQPFVYDPNEKNRHKFMVQTLYAPAGVVSLEEALKGNTGAVIETKLKCVFDMPADGGICGSPAVEAAPVVAAATSSTAAPTEPVAASAAVSAASASSTPAAADSTKAADKPAASKGSESSSSPSSSPRATSEAAVSTGESGVRQRPVATTASKPATPPSHASPAPAHDVQVKQQRFPPGVIIVLLVILAGWLVGQFVFRS